MDTSGVADGVAPVRKQDSGKCHVVQFGSRTRSVEGRLHDTFGQEALTIVFPLRTFRHYLKEEPFVALSNQRALQTALAKAYIHKRLVCRLSLVSEYDSQICHLPENLIVIADYLSRSIGTMQCAPNVFDGLTKRHLVNSRQ